MLCLLVGKAARANTTVLFVSELKKKDRISPFQPVYPNRKEVKFGPFRRTKFNVGVSEEVHKASEQQKIASKTHEVSQVSV